MPFAIVFIGVLLCVTAIKDTYSQLGTQLAKDFTGDKSFLVWASAIGAVAALGYANSLKPFARTFVALILIAMFISNKGVANKFFAAIKQGGTAPTTAGSATANSASGSILDTTLNYGPDKMLNTIWDLTSGMNGAVDVTSGKDTQQPADTGTDWAGYAKDAAAVAVMF